MMIKRFTVEFQMECEGVRDKAGRLLVRGNIYKQEIRSETFDEVIEKLQAFNNNIQELEK
jgi:uncharacterized protein YlzI (FlbEa/FlbD family)